MADVIDKAQQYTDREMARRIMVIRRLTSAAGAGEGAAPTACASCGEDIPEARRRAVPGCTRCVGCQAALEKEPS